MMRNLVTNWFWILTVTITVVIAGGTFAFIRNDTLQVTLDNAPNDTMYLTVSFGHPIANQQNPPPAAWAFAGPFTNHITIHAPHRSLLVPAKDMLELTPFAAIDPTPPTETTPTQNPVADSTEPPPTSETCTLTTNNPKAHVTIVGAGDPTGYGWFPSIVTTDTTLRQRFHPLKTNNHTVIPVFATAAVEIRTLDCPITVNATLTRGWNWLTTTETPDTTTLENTRAPHHITIETPTTLPQGSQP